MGRDPRSPSVVQYKVSISFSFSIPRGFPRGFPPVISPYSRIDDTLLSCSLFTFSIVTLAPSQQWRHWLWLCLSFFFFFLGANWWNWIGKEVRFGWEVDFSLLTGLRFSFVFSAFAPVHSVGLNFYPQAPGGSWFQIGDLRGD